MLIQPLDPRSYVARFIEALWHGLIHHSNPSNRHQGKQHNPYLRKCASNEFANLHLTSLEWPAQTVWTKLGEVPQDTMRPDIQTILPVHGRASATERQMLRP